MTENNLPNASLHDDISTSAIGVKNVVLVHGALADASGFRAVYDILKQQGYHVSLTSQPLTSRAADIAAVRRVLDLQDGPVALVGHPTRAMSAHFDRDISGWSPTAQPGHPLGKSL